MLKTTVKFISRTTRSFQKAGKALADVAGVSEPVDHLQKGVEELPISKHLKRVVKTAKDELMGEELPLYKAESGPYKVKRFSGEFVDEERGREVPLVIYSPKDTEKSPVVLLSHGLAGNGTTYRYLGKHLASHGYTVIQPQHVGSDTKATVLKTPLFAFSQEELLDRKADLSFALDLLESEELPEEVRQSVDLERVALAGHSFGALTAQAVAGVETTDSEGQLLDISEDRIDAFIAISPYGDSAPTQILGMDTGTYDKISKPVLFMHGEDDELFTFSKGAKAHSTPYHGVSSEHKYQVIVDGTSHLDFAQIFGLLNPEAADMTASTSVAFLDAHLMNDDNALDYLRYHLPQVARSRDSQAY